jgi:hypothetical protein
MPNECFITFLYFRRANQVLPNGGKNSEIWRQFLADFHSVASMAFGLHGGQTRDAGDLTERLKDFYNLHDMEEVGNLLLIVKQVCLNLF